MQSNDEAVFSGDAGEEKIVGANEKFKYFLGDKQDMYIRIFYLIGKCVL